MKKTFVGFVPENSLPNMCLPCKTPLEINYDAKVGTCIRCECTYHIDGVRLFKTEPCPIGDH